MSNDKRDFVPDVDWEALAAHTKPGMEPLIERDPFYLEFKVLGDPRPFAQKRPRAVAMPGGTRLTKKGNLERVHHARMHDDPANVSAKEQIKHAAIEANEGLPDRLCDAPVALWLRAVIPVPVSWPDWKKKVAEAGAIAPTAVPDLSNIQKLVEDALQGLFLTNDAQVCLTGPISKRYGARPELWVILRALPLLTPHSKKPAWYKPETVGPTAAQQELME